MFSYTWFDTDRFINNAMFHVYITIDIISFTIFNFLYITLRTISINNTKNLLSNSTCCKINKFVSHYWILLIPQMNSNTDDILDFPDKFITIKGNILVLKFSILTLKQVGNMQFIIWSAIKYCFDYIVYMFLIITIRIINNVIANMSNST